jgi:hypothetical protein
MIEPSDLLDDENWQLWQLEQYGADYELLNTVEARILHTVFPRCPIVGFQTHDDVHFVCILKKECEPRVANTLRLCNEMLQIQFQGEPNVAPDSDEFCELFHEMLVCLADAAAAL